MPDKTLYGINTDGSRDKSLPYQMLIDLGGIHAGMFFLDVVDLSNGILI